MEGDLSDGDWEAMIGAMEETTGVSTALPSKNGSVTRTPSFTSGGSRFSLQGPGNSVVVPLPMEINSPTEFSVADTFNEPVRKVLSSFDFGHWDQKNCKWVFPLSVHDDLLDTLQKVPGVFLDKSGIPASALKLFLSPSSFRNPWKLAVDEVELRKEQIPASLWNYLMPFQKEGVQFAISRAGRCVIGDEMGLGKTLQAIAVACAFREEWPVLVICLSVLKLSWAQSFEKHVPGLSPMDISVVKVVKHANVKAKVVIVSYHMMPQLRDRLMNQNFRIIICDESHSLKNNTSKRCQAVSPLVKASKRALLLSGTAAPSRPSELFSQLNMVNSELFPDEVEYGKRYCNGQLRNIGNGRKTWDFGGSSNLTELSIVLRHALLIRRLKRDVLNQLPSKLRRQVYVDISDADRKSISSFLHKYRSLKKANRAAVKGSEVVFPDSFANDATTSNVYDDTKGNVDGLLMELYRMTSRAKLQPSLEYVERLLEGTNGPQKFIVFAHHGWVISGLTQILQKKRVSFILIDGKTPAQVKQDNVHRFQTDKTVRVAVLSLMAASTGLTLTAADTVVFVELAWTPGVMIQAEDRVHRIGQRNTCDIQYLIAKDTLDTDIWAILSRKLGVVGEALGGRGASLDVDEYHSGGDLSNTSRPREATAGVSFVSPVDATTIKQSSPFTSWNESDYSGPGSRRSASPNADPGSLNAGEASLSSRCRVSTSLPACRSADTRSIDALSPGDDKQAAATPNEGWNTKLRPAISRRSPQQHRHENPPPCEHPPERRMESFFSNRSRYSPPQKTVGNSFDPGPGQQLVGAPPTAIAKQTKSLKPLEKHLTCTNEVVPVVHVTEQFRASSSRTSPAPPPSLRLGGKGGYVDQCLEDDLKDLDASEWEALESGTWGERPAKYPRHS
eukprot:Rmarinus@m.13974